MKEEDELTYGETTKQPFPELEDVEFISLNIPQYYSDLDEEIPSIITFHTFINDTYNILKKAHKNGEDVTWQLKQTDPHAEIKAEYEKAVAEGKIVKVFRYEGNDSSWEVTSNLSWQGSKYRLECYNIDWNKLLSWSYANGEFVECEFSDDEFDNFKSYRLVAFQGTIFSDSEHGDWHDYCRLAEGVEIKDEWLKEVK